MRVTDGLAVVAFATQTGDHNIKSGTPALYKPLRMRKIGWNEYVQKNHCDHKRPPYTLAAVVRYRRGLM